MTRNEEYLYNNCILVLQNEVERYQAALTLLKTNNFRGFSEVCVSWLRVQKIEISAHSTRFVINVLWYEAEGDEFNRDYIESIAEYLSASKTVPSPSTNPIKEEIPMTKPIFETKSFVNGQDVDQMTEEQLISAIRTVESEIENLLQVKTVSKKIKAKIRDMEIALGHIVAVLDAK